jgi:hypothetical protein
MRLDGPQSQSDDMEKDSELDPSIVQLITSHYTNCADMAPYFIGI